MGAHQCVVANRKSGSRTKSNDWAQKLCPQLLSMPLYWIGCSFAGKERFCLNKKRDTICMVAVLL